MGRRIEKCCRCKFFVDQFGGGGRCHLNPPVVVTPRSISSFGPLEDRQEKIYPAIFETPEIHPNNFCSHFKEPDLDDTQEEK